MKEKKKKPGYSTNLEKRKKTKRKSKKEEGRIQNIKKIEMKKLERYCYSAVGTLLILKIKIFFLLRIFEVL